MFAKVVVFLAVVAVAAAADLSVGKMGGRLIFYKNFSASPAIWKQVQAITVNATDDALIRRVVVIDNRPEKDGEAKVVDGGVGQNNVTIGLRAPLSSEDSTSPLKCTRKKESRRRRNTQCLLVLIFKCLSRRMWKILRNPRRILLTKLKAKCRSLSWCIQL
uniref:REPAT28 n=1 Tax=Spodoptera exigua TaxID=7107 RepID=I0B5U8_SPOEX|nr:REPAT28 [Spodoptera exigua]